MQTTILAYPRLGEKRELKVAFFSDRLIDYGNSCPIILHFIV